MDTLRPLPAGHLLSSLLDQDIAHIRRVMPLSLAGDFGGPILAPSYWRMRLHQLLATGHVNKGQLADIDSLLFQIELHELNAASEEAASAKHAVGNGAGRR
ncbi:hypothetical protein [Paraburkholderia sacchari]|uniref:hypothetical protein n=1 Tax=Paraburkholderia sacchari TaxID=159450 RepID=UPI001F426603|nr:hypothetical protein [Paraburkholderia sacchari]